METNQQIVQLLERIQSVLEEFKVETKQQFSSNIEQENWKAVDCLIECASWIDAGIGACGQMSARCVSLEVADPATASDDQSISRSPWINKEASNKLPFFFDQFEDSKYNQYLYKHWLGHNWEKVYPSDAKKVFFSLAERHNEHPFWPTFFDQGSARPSCQESRSMSHIHPEVCPVGCSR